MNERVDASVSVATASIATAAPFVGNYSPILVFALLGATIALSRMRGLKAWPAVLFLFRAVSIAAVFAGVAAEWLSHRLHIDAAYLLAPVALAIAVVGDGWFRAKDWLLERVKGSGNS